LSQSLCPIFYLGYPIQIASFSGLLPVLDVGQGGRQTLWFLISAEKSMIRGALVLIFIIIPLIP